MTLLDFIVLIPLCWFGFLGFKNGLIYEVFSLLALVLGIWISYHFSDWIALLFSDSLLAKPIALVLTFVIVILLVHFAGRLMAKVIKLAIPEIVDHIFGLLFGAGKVLLVFSVILYVIQDIDKAEILLKKETKQQSFMYQYVEPIIPHLMAWKDAKQTPVELESDTN